MPVPTGTATPWREVGDSPEGGPLLYVRQGRSTGAAELLAEQLRADGVLPSYWPAMQVATAARLEETWLGTLDGAEVVCDEDGWTPSGDLAEGPAEVLAAWVDPGAFE